jgi:hypothetical protein
MDQETGDGMKALLMHRDCDFDSNQPLPWNTLELTQDLDLDVLLDAMAGDDKFLRDVARKALLCGPRNDIDTLLYRQDCLKDCLQNSVGVRGLYELVVEAIEKTKKESWGITSHYPSSVLYSSTSLLEMLVGTLRRLRETAAAQLGQFKSEAFTTLFAMMTRELNEEYLATIEDHLTISRFREGVLLSAQLGGCNQSSKLVLRKSAGRKPKWFERLFRKGPPGYTFHLAERDEAGARIFGEMRHRGISRVTVALAESAEHVVHFFTVLRTELAFYVACTNLHARLIAKAEPVCFPRPVTAGQRRHDFRGLFDVCLSLRMEGRIVANTANASDKNLVVITGANQGGKSSFLRSIGIAQLMMQCGMFVGAETFEGELCSALLTHYKREEDATMQSGKFDEELARMNQIVEHLRPDATLLFNESFSATNEREGSEIARQIVSALLEKRVRIFYVTHLHEFARTYFDKGGRDTLFLLAERKADGSRTFKLSEGEPLDTSYGEDLYLQVFGANGELASAQEEDAASTLGSSTQD